ncbi:uncharacterized protein YMR196W [Nematostella vectensis]|uniref:uncharacterized protein YMR196W n=1 Tax=Nematostella vectensis TaxID=45351 RepID=UPI002077756A|nr:uncharacterized protein YMR196W [Nematostella vectensis]
MTMSGNQEEIPNLLNKGMNTGLKRYRSQFLLESEIKKLERIIGRRADPRLQKLWEHLKSGTFDVDQVREYINKQLKPVHPPVQRRNSFGALLRKARRRGNNKRKSSESEVIFDRPSTESRRLQESKARGWKEWGPYLSERQWGTVREDYSSDGNCWDYFPHDQARSRAYRWGEDGIMGISDDKCRLCFSVALWNEQDPIIKERLFGLTGNEGNHGEDVKECYYYLDSTPTHSYMKALYKYPQQGFPYASLVRENRERTKEDSEFELTDTGVFDEGRYWDVFTEYAKNTPGDVIISITVVNRGPDRARLHVLPTVWFRNTWSWGCKHEVCTRKPRIKQTSPGTAECCHDDMGTYVFAADAGPDGEDPDLLFTDNETNFKRLYKARNSNPYVKDAFHRYLINKELDAVNPRLEGTKMAPHYVLDLAAGQRYTIRCRLSAQDERVPMPFGKDSFDDVIKTRKAEADEFFKTVIPDSLTEEETLVSRQSYAGLLWSKQFYYYITEDWLKGDPSMPPPPRARLSGRNSEWKYLSNCDVISMPDKWEYPWYASWDLAFHMLPFAKIDPDFAKHQLLLFLSDTYMAPNGQIPAYEFAFSDVNPPVHALACYRVYQMTAGKRGGKDKAFLAKCFQKLLLNFTWWVNRKDPDGLNLFGGGFLGLDNVGVFDRSKTLPGGGRLCQADGTAWMALYCIVMLNISLELALADPTYEDMALKFFEHFTHIADAMNKMSDGYGLWDSIDGFYYDHFHSDTSESFPLRVRSIVGLVPLLACWVLDGEQLDKLPAFRNRLNQFVEKRKELALQIVYPHSKQDLQLLAIPSREQLHSLLAYMMDEDEFLSDFGVRSVSRYHLKRPYCLELEGKSYQVDYVPGESNTYMFGGNSNWRGPVWFCVNHLIVEALKRYDQFYGDSFQVECPTGSGKLMRLRDVSQELSLRLTSLFLPDSTGRRPCHGNEEQYAVDPDWNQLVLFYEYFDGDSGRGCGASHQTGWTSLVSLLLEKLANERSDR